MRMPTAVARPPWAGAPAAHAKQSACRVSFPPHSWNHHSHTHSGDVSGRHASTVQVVKRPREPRCFCECRSGAGPAPDVSPTRTPAAAPQRLAPLPFWAARRPNVAFARAGPRLGRSATDDAIHSARRRPARALCGVGFGMRFPWWGLGGGLGQERPCVGVAAMGLHGSGHHDSAPYSSKRHAEI